MASCPDTVPWPLEASFSDADLLEAAIRVPANAEDMVFELPRIWNLWVSHQAKQHCTGERADGATSHNEEHTERRRQDGTSDKHRQATSDNLLGHAGKANEKRTRGAREFSHA